MNNYIFGAGISGLISHYYNPSYKIISPEIGGQLASNKSIMISFFIHSCPENRQFLDELGIAYKERRIKIFYYDDGKILERITIADRRRFITNKMGEYDYDSNSVDIDDTNLSTDTNYLDVLAASVPEIMAKLKPRDDEVIVGKVKLINHNRKFLLMQDKDMKLVKLPYDRIISTIPANDFFYMLYNYKNSYNFNYLPSTYVMSSERPSFMKEDGLYYVYSKDLIYNRVQPYGEGYVYEITGLPSDEEIARQIKGVINIERRYVGIIKSINENIDFRNIKFIGRFSQWQHHIKIQHNITKAKRIVGNEKQ